MHCCCLTIAYLFFPDEVVGDCLQLYTTTKKVVSICQRTLSFDRPRLTVKRGLKDSMVLQVGLQISKKLLFRRASNDIRCRSHNVLTVVRINKIHPTFNLSLAFWWALLLQKKSATSGLEATSTPPRQRQEVPQSKF